MIESGDGKCDDCSVECSADLQGILLSNTKTIEKDVLENLVISDVSSAVTATAELLSVAVADSADDKYGNAELLDMNGDGELDSVSFMPIDIVSDVVRLNCAIKITAEGKNYQRIIPVNVVPATIMYYETDFSNNVFDLSNDPSALFKPKSLLLDFDANDTTTWKGYNATVTKDAANGVWKGTVSNYDPNIHMEPQGQIAYTIRNNDVIQIRILRQQGLGGKLSVFFSTTNNAGYNGSHQFADSPTGEYEVLTFTIASSFVGQTVDAFRIDPVDDGQKNGGTFEIDYIYIGSASGAPNPVSTGGSGTTVEADTDFLYFDFLNTELDRARYSSTIYNNKQYDIGSWTYRSKTLLTPVYNNAEGTLGLILKENLNSLN